MTCEDCLHFRVCNAFGLITESYYEKTCAEFENRDDIFDKQTPKKPDFEGDGYDDSGNIIYDTWICPCCENRYEVDYDMYQYCPACGQALDWSDYE